MGSYASLPNLPARTRNAPTTMTKIQNRLHELERPIASFDLARDMGLNAQVVNRALRRLWVKGIVIRFKAPVAWKRSTGRLTKRGKPLFLKRSYEVWVYEILHED